MVADATTTFDREALLDEVVTAYLKEARAGRTPEPAAWQARYPELATDLAEFFADRAGWNAWPNRCAQWLRRRRPRWATITRSSRRSPAAVWASCTRHGRRA